MQRLATTKLGFTMIELVTTLVIVGVLGAVAAPRFFDLQAFSERGYVDEVAAALRYGQKIAIASGCDVAVFVNDTSYSAQQRAAEATCNDGALGWATQVRRANGNTVTGTAPNDVLMAPAATIVVFHASGDAESNSVITAGPFTISVSRDGGAVTVTP